MKLFSTRPAHAAPATPSWALATLAVATLFSASSRATADDDVSQISTAVGGGSGQSTCGAQSTFASEDVNKRTSDIVAAILEIHSEILTFANEDGTKIKTATHAIKDLVLAAGLPQCVEVGMLLIRIKDERKLKCVGDGSERLIWLVRNITRDFVLEAFAEGLNEKIQTLEQAMISEATKVQSETHRCVEKEVDFRPEDLNRILNAVQTCVHDATFKEDKDLDYPAQGESEILKLEHGSKGETQGTLILDTQNKEVGSTKEKKKKKKKPTNKKKSKNKREKMKDGHKNKNEDTDESDVESGTLDLGTETSSDKNEL